jgi:hypothetical protein
VGAVSQRHSEAPLGSATRKRSTGRSDSIRSMGMQQHYMNPPLPTAESGGHYDVYSGRAVRLCEEES